MKPLLITLIVFAGCIFAFVQYREHDRTQRDTVESVVRMEPTAPARSLEERAAAAQGTTLPPQAPPPTARSVQDEPVDRERPAALTGRYKCDGRSYCSQMHSCEEATWFLEHCPGMNMDGEGDGIPCERQWCKHPFSR